MLTNFPYVSPIFRMFITVFLLISVMFLKIIIQFVFFNLFCHFSSLLYVELSVICGITCGIITVSWNFRAWQIRLQILPLPFLSCMILGRSFNSLEYVFICKIQVCRTTMQNYCRLRIIDVVMVVIIVRVIDLLCAQYYAKLCALFQL